MDYRKILLGLTVSSLSISAFADLDRLSKRRTKIKSSQFISFDFPLTCQFSLELEALNTNERNTKTTGGSFSKAGPRSSQDKQCSGGRFSELMVIKKAQIDRLFSRDTENYLNARINRKNVRDGNTDSLDLMLNDIERAADFGPRCDFIVRGFWSAGKKRSNRKDGRISLCFFQDDGVTKFEGPYWYPGSDNEGTSFFEDREFDGLWEGTINSK